MVVEMKVQYCREELWDSFYTDETIFLNTFFETFFLQILNNMDKTSNKCYSTRYSSAD